MGCKACSEVAFSGNLCLGQDCDRTPCQPREMHCHSYLIFVILSPHKKIWGSIFLHTKAGKSRQNRIATKQHKSGFTTKNRVNFRFLHICRVEKIWNPPNLATFSISPQLSCIKIRNFSTYLHLYVGYIYRWQISGLCPQYLYLYLWYLSRSKVCDRTPCQARKMHCPLRCTDSLSPIVWCGF